MALILFDTGPSGHAARFSGPEARIIAHSPQEVPGALAAMARARDAGLWLAGYAAYELGYALEPRLAPLMPAGRRTPLLAFGAFRTPEDGRAALAECDRAAGSALLSVPRPVWSRDTYRTGFDRVAALIAAGDCYQVNLTMPMRATATGSGLALYGALRARQAARFGAYLDLGPEAGPVLLSRSPELFFRIDRAGRVEARPMKGTAPREADPRRDRARAAALARSPKDRAENLMIVDLLRNDLGRLCAIGSIRVPALYEVETLATVHQMTSCVTGQLMPGVTPEALLRALFPCGSVTGAPKIRAMEIIRMLEAEPRGAYCGAIGWLAPDGRAEFNVAIRTLSLCADGSVTLNVGGGVVQDSTAAGEYEEALWKARFARLT